MNESILERFRVRARQTKAIAMEKHKAGDLAGAKTFAVKAKKLNPCLTGLARLNAILDVLLGFEKKIDGEVDWYAVLAVDPTADVKTIQNRYKKLLMSIILDDGDDSVGGTDEAKKILADSWRFLCDENNKKLYDMQRQERADYEKQQRLKRASQGPSFTSYPEMPKHVHPHQIFSKENERMVHPPSRVFSQVQSLTYTPVTLTAPKHVVKSQRPKMFKEENEELVEVRVENFVQPPLRGESKRKAPSDVPQAKQIRRINEDAGFRSIERKGDNVVSSVIKPRLERYVSAFQHGNVASSSSTKAHQESKKCNAVNRVNTESNKPVFHRRPNPKTFPKQDLRFSHQVASHLLTGQEGKNAPKGCLELDPAAMSLELLKSTEEELKKLKNQEEFFETMNEEAHAQVYKIKQEKMD